MNQIDALISLSHSFANALAGEPVRLKGDGSDRQIYRFRTGDQSWIGVTHSNKQENQAFVYFSNHYRARGIAVPKVFATDLDHGCYLLEDLGDCALSELIDQWNGSTPTDRNAILSAYTQVLDVLLKLHFVGREAVDLQMCYPKSHLDGQEFHAYIDYFRSYFVELFPQEPFLPEAVERELEMLPNILGAIPQTGLVHLDFQSRNIMWHRDQPWLIDYQSSCWGSWHYDLASLLYASRAGLDDRLRQLLLQVFHERLQKYHPIHWDDFLEQFLHFVLIRRLRSLGTYGFLPYQKGKYYFLEGIPKTLHEVWNLLKDAPSLQQWTALRHLFERWAEHPELNSLPQLYAHLGVDRTAYLQSRRQA